ncbi:MAG TPA: lysophospholipid acyltransferase family protein [Anaerolineales bacterium]|nr:lysophospholipid acyltransferase family protein [Anaerolineales bacterium]
MSGAYRVPWKFRLSRPLLCAGFRGVFHILANVKITGKENVPFGRPYVVAMNHVSIFDPPFAASFWPEQLEIIGASDVFEKPGQGQILKAYGVIPVHRGDYDRTLFMRVISVIEAGYPLLIAPEGGRSHVIAMRRAMPGVAYIVEQTKVPVVPAAIVGTTEDFWHRATHGDRPSLEMHIGKPITLPENTAKGKEKHETRQANADLVMRHLAGLLPEEYRGVYADSAIIP